MRTIEELAVIQRKAEKSLIRKELPGLMRRAVLTGSISGGRPHSELQLTFVVALGTLAFGAVALGVTECNLTSAKRMVHSTPVAQLPANR